MQKKAEKTSAICSTTKVHQNSFQAPKQFRHTVYGNHGVNNLMLFLACFYIIAMVLSVEGWQDKNYVHLSLALCNFEPMKI